MALITSGSVFRSPYPEGRTSLLAGLTVGKPSRGQVNTLAVTVTTMTTMPTLMLMMMTMTLMMLSTMTTMMMRMMMISSTLS